MILSVEPEHVARWLDEMQIPAEQQPGLVDLYYRSRSAGRFAGIDPNAFQIGLNVIDLLVDLIHLNERGIPEVPKTVLVEPSWRDGLSLARGKKDVIGVNTDAAFS